MDEKLHIVHHLYGEGEDPAELQRLLEDEALRADYQALSEAKQYLDQRQRARPDPLVVDRIVAAAAAPRAGLTTGKRRDRAARPAARRYRLAGALSGVLALVLVVGIGLNQFLLQDRAPAESEAAVFSEDAPAAADEAEALAPRDADVAAAPSTGALAPAQRRIVEERLAAASPALQDAEPATEVEEDALPSTAVVPAPPLEANQMVAADARSLGQGARREDEAVPAWDEADELLRVHRRIDMLRARSRELIWDESAVISLDSLPAQPSVVLPGLNAAGKKQ